MRNVVSVLSVLVVLMLSTFSPTPSYADVAGVDRGFVSAVYYPFNAQGDCRINISGENSISIVDFPNGELANLCDKGIIFPLLYLEVRVKDKTTLCYEVGNFCSVFEAVERPSSLPPAEFK